MEKSITRKESEIGYILCSIAAILAVALFGISMSEHDCQAEVKKVKQQEALRQCVEKNKTIVPDLINYCKFTTKGE